MNHRILQVFVQFKLEKEGGASLVLGNEVDVTSIMVANELGDNKAHANTLSAVVAPALVLLEQFEEICLIFLLDADS